MHWYVVGFCVPHAPLVHVNWTLGSPAGKVNPVAQVTVLEVPEETDARVAGMPFVMGTAPQAKLLILYKH